MKPAEEISTQENFLHDRLNGLRPGVVICIINKNSEVLFGLRKEHQIWEMPQGGIKRNENLAIAARAEAKEELGKEFAEVLFIPENPLVAIDQVFFPKKNIQNKKLTVNGKEIPMIGKKYYFCVAGLPKDIEPKKIEHSDFKWVSYEEGKSLTSQISQKGKKRILDKILDVLKENKFIK